MNAEITPGDLLREIQAKNLSHEKFKVPSEILEAGDRELQKTFWEGNGFMQMFEKSPFGIQKTYRTKKPITTVKVLKETVDWFRELKSPEEFPGPTGYYGPALRLKTEMLIVAGRKLEMGGGEKRFEEGLLSRPLIDVPRIPECRDLVRDVVAARKELERNGCNGPYVLVHGGGGSEYWWWETGREELNREVVRRLRIVKQDNNILDVVGVDDEPLRSGNANDSRLGCLLLVDLSINRLSMAWEPSFLATFDGDYESVELRATVSLGLNPLERDGICLARIKL